MSKLPDRMCDPDIYPAMTREVQQACIDFSSIAADIIDRHHLKQEEFNKLQETAKNNAWYRFQVERELKRLENQIQKQ